MKRFFAIVASALTVGMVSAAYADVVLTQKMVTETMMMGAMDVTVTQKIKGDRDYSSTQMTSGGMMAAEGMENIMVNRLDKGVMWIINPVAKSFQEIKLSDLKAMAEQAKELSLYDSSAVAEYDWAIDIRKLGDATVNGQACTGIKGIATGVSRANPQEKILISYEIWKGKNLPGYAELTAHNKRLMELTGQDPSVQTGMVRQVLDKGSAQFEKLATATEELEGFPIRTVIKVTTSVEALGNLGEQVGDDPQALAMMQQMKEMFKAKAGADGMMPVVSMTADVTSIETASVDAAVFELPEGFTRGY